MDDRTVVERQLGRTPRAFRSVAVRCPFGRPAVTEQEPYDSDGNPFPTTYYVTCRWLVAAISRLEAAGGVERWSERVAAEPALAASLARPGYELGDRIFAEVEMPWPELCCMEGDDRYAADRP
jgi:hypothetical protein